MSPKTRFALLTAVMTALGGCANPIRVIKAPGYDPALSAAPTSEPNSMGEAVRKLHHVRAEYYEAVREQVGASQNVTSGLVWLGAAITGIAAGGAHPDAVLYPALIGGTAYGLSQTQLDARRLQVWQEGIKALDCAKEASLPFDLEPDHLAQIRAALTKVSERRAATEAATNQAQREASDPLNNAGGRSALQDLVKEARAAIALADATSSSARQLVDAARGRELSAAVDRIDQQVVATQSNLALNPSAIKGLVAGIGGFASVFAPGANIQGIIDSATNAFNRKFDVAGAHSGPARALADASANLQQELRQLATAQSLLSSLLGSVNVDAVSKALKKCDVAEVVTAMSFEPPLLQLDEKKARAEEVEIKGGLRPYEIRVLGEVADGMAITSSTDTIVVKVNDKVPAGEYRVRVRDSSNPPQSRQYVVRVGPGGPSGGEKDKDAGVPQAWQSLAEAMRKFAYDSLNGVNFSVTAATLEGDRLTVTLKCSKQKSLQPDVLREQLAVADKKAVQRLRAAGALDGQFSQIDLSRSAACLAG
jgi:hypothetical protein